MIFCVPVGRASLYAEYAVFAEQVGELRVGGVWPEQGLHRVQVDDVTVAHHLEAGTKQETELNTNRKRIQEGYNEVNKKKNGLFSELTELPQKQ